MTNKAKVIGVISIKGGVGKTTTVSNLGAVLADEFMKKVLIVDANFSAPNLGIHLGVVKPDRTIHDVLLGNSNLRDAILEHESGFDVLPASLVPKKINPYALSKKLEGVKGDYDFIIIDSSPSMNEEILSTMIASDELLVVSTPDYPTLSCSLHAVNVAKKKGTPIAGMILNKVRDKSFELSLEEIEEATGTPILAVLPDDIRVLEALSNTLPVALHAPRGRASVEYKKLGAALCGEEYGDPRLFHRVKNKILRKNWQAERNRQDLFSRNSGEK